MTATAAVVPDKVTFGRTIAQRASSLTCSLLQIDTAGLWPDVAVLLVTLGAFLALLAAAQLRLSRGVGAALLGLYAVYLLYIVLTTWVFDVYGTRGA